MTNNNIQKKEFFMKKVLSVLSAVAIMATTSFAAEGKHFTKLDNGAIGGLIGNSAVFIYKKNDAANIKDPVKLKLLSNIAKKNICTTKNTRSIIDTLGTNIIFIYLDNNDGATIVTIEDCSGIPAPKK